MNNIVKQNQIKMFLNEDTYLLNLKRNLNTRNRRRNVVLIISSTKTLNQLFVFLTATHFLHSLKILIVYFSLKMQVKQNL